MEKKYVTIYPAFYPIDDALNSEERISYASYNHESRIVDKIPRDAAMNVYKDWMIKLKDRMGDKYIYLETKEEGRFFTYQISLKTKTDKDALIELECRPSRDNFYCVHLRVLRYAGD